MTDTIKVTCENIGATIDAPMGTTLGDIARELNIATARPFLAAYVNHRIKELGYKIYTPVTVRFIDITSFEGIRVYQRTCWFLLQKAAAERYPGRKLHIRHSMGGSGFYCEIEGIEPPGDAEIETLMRRMRAIVEADYPIVRRKMLTSEINAVYERFGFDDKIALLNSRPRLYSDLYILDDIVGFFYGALAPDTSYIHLFDIRRYYNGFYIALPTRRDPMNLDPNVQFDEMFDIFHEYHMWVDILGVPTVGRLNSKVLAGDGGELIKVAEAFHEKKIADIADRIEGWDRGADGYLGKPFNIEELDTMIDNLIGNRLRLKGKFSGAQDTEAKIAPPELKGNDEALMEKIMRIINDQIDNPELNVEMLGQSAGISRVQLHRKLKDLIGMTPSDFIRNIRLKRACRLLQKPDVEVTQVAYAVGFSSQPHFSTAFKRYTGFSPTEYRQRCLRGDVPPEPKNPITDHI